MLQHLTSPTLLESAHLELLTLFRQHAEWLFVCDGIAQSLRRDEIDVSVSHERLVLSCWTDKGAQLWRIVAWHWNGHLLEFETSRRMGGEITLIELIPRTPAKAVAATIRAARQIRCERLAQLAAALQLETTIERLALSRGTKPGQPGRYAQILLRRRRERIAVTGPVVASQPSAIDAFLSSSLLWFRRTSERIKPPHVEQLWLIVPAELLNPTLYRVALLRSGLQNIIKIFTVNDGLSLLNEVSCPDKQEFWKTNSRDSLRSLLQ